MKITLSGQPDKVTVDNLKTAIIWFKSNVQSNFFVEQLRSDSQLTTVTKALNELSKLTSDITQADLLHTAAKLGYDNFIEKLIEEHNNVIKKGIGYKNQGGNTPLHIAALEGQKKIVDLFLYHGADPNALNKAGMTPLALAASKSSNTSFLSKKVGPSSSNQDRINIIENLIDRTDNLQAQSLLLNLTKFPTELVQDALTKAPNLIDELDEQGRNVLHRAIINKNATLTSFLSKNETLMSQKTTNGSTAFILACRYGSPEIIQALLDTQQDLCHRESYLSIKDEHQKTALDYLQDWVSMTPNQEIYQRLLNNFPGYKGNEPGAPSSFRM